MQKLANGKYELTEEELVELKADQLKLVALDNAGVDSWEWYEDAIEEYLGEFDSFNDMAQTALDIQFKGL